MHCRLDKTGWKIDSNIKIIKVRYSNDYGRELTANDSIRIYEKR